MRCYSRIKVFLIGFFIFQLFACESELNPCECGRNLTKTLGEIDEKLESECEDHLLNLTPLERKKWNKRMLDCSEQK
jgi:hypothetical protein